MAISISYASDALIGTLISYTTKKSLLKEGWVEPPRCVLNTRIRRGSKIHIKTVNLSVIVLVLVFTFTELAIEFSTGSAPWFTTKKIEIKLASQVADYQSLINGSTFYIEKMRDSVQRVENICFDLRNDTYHKVTLNISEYDLFQGLGDQAKCFENYSNAIPATTSLRNVKFLASDFLKTGMWNKYETRKARDFESKTEEEVRLIDEDITIGPLEEFSFLSVNFSRDWYVPDSATQLTGSRSEADVTKFYTANYKNNNGYTMECLVISDNISNWDANIVEACILPLNEKRSILAMFDDINGTQEYQLILSVAYDNMTTFRDLNTLKAASWMIGTNDGMHTTRELAKLSVMSTLMIEGITADGFETSNIIVGDKLSTVPTIDEWGVILFGAAIGLLIIGISVLRMKQKRMPISGNLATSHGIASHWLVHEREKDDASSAESQVILTIQGGKGMETSRVVVADKSDQICKT